LEDPRLERQIDLLLAGGAAVIGLLMVAYAWQVPGAAPKVDPADVRAIELRGLVQEASEALPADTRSAIGLEGQPLATRKGVLDDVKGQLAAAPWVTELRIVWTAMAVGWREDAAARSEIAELASDPKRLEAHRAVLDDLLRLSNGEPAKDYAGLAGPGGVLAKFGASRWLLGRLEVRQLEASGEGARAAQLAADLNEVAESAVARKMWAFGLELGLVSLGLLVLIAMSWFLRPWLVRRTLANDLAGSPFRLDRTRRVLLAWFIGAQVIGFAVGIVLSSLGLGVVGAALSVGIQGLAHGALAIAVIQLWGREERDARSPWTALGLTGPGHAKKVLVWIVPALALCAFIVQVASYLNLLILRRAPDTQSAVELVANQGGLAVTLLIGAGAVLVAPVVEELLFRGFLFRNLRDSIGRGPAMFLSGAIFGAVHLQPTLILPLGGLGVALALLYEWSGSIWVPIAAHAAWNALMLVQIEAVWRI
jgi:membrane protease YdiL (CAAX protease family)